MVLLKAVERGRRTFIEIEDDTLVTAWKLAKSVYERKIDFCDWKLALMYANIDGWTFVYYPLTMPVQVIEKARKKFDESWSEIHSELLCAPAKPPCKIPSYPYEYLLLAYFMIDVLGIAKDIELKKVRLRRPFRMIEVDDKCEYVLMLFVDPEELPEGLLDRIYSSSEEEEKHEWLKYRAIFGGISSSELNELLELERKDYDLIRTIAKPKVSLADREKVSHIFEEFESE